MVQQGVSKFDTKQLRASIEETERDLRSMYDGELPQPSPQAASEEKKNPEQRPVPEKSYLTQKVIGDIKGLHSNMDTISALMTVCREEFQLQPQFDIQDEGPEAHSRTRFKAICKFGLSSVATCAGQSKKEAKAAAAKLALFKAAPNIYNAIYPDDAPPADLTEAAQKAAESQIKDSELCLGDPQMLQIGC